VWPVVLTLLSTIVPNSGSNPPFLANVRERVEIGTLREEALEELSDAWFHTYCGFDVGAGDDIFFFGPHDPELVQIIVVTTRLENNAARVTDVFMVEPDRMASIQSCIPDDIFD
jgi:hypothetical protein